MLKLQRYNVDFNKKLALQMSPIKISKNDCTTLNKSRDLKYFPMNCGFFNFDDDHVEFTLKIGNEILEGFKIIKQELYLMFNETKHKIPIKTTEIQTRDGDKFININACIKDCLFHLFENYEKTLKLLISYSTAVKKNVILKIEFSSPIENVKLNILGYKSLSNFNPHDNDGLSLKKLFKENFQQYRGITFKQSELLKTLMAYKNTSIAKKFENYDFLKMFKYMVHIEYMEEEKKIKKYSLDSTHIYKFRLSPISIQKTVDDYLNQMMWEEEINNFKKNLYIVKSQAKIPIDGIEVGSIFITEQTAYQLSLNSSRKPSILSHYGKINYIFGDIILFHFHDRKKEKTAKFLPESKYHVDFVPNRTAISRVIQILDDMEEFKKKCFLKKFEMQSVEKRTCKSITNIEWLNPSISTNKEQQIAVKNILNRTSFPAPFIIFGGPGTGKSSTIVEAISQIIKSKPKSYVLLTAGSNSACDDLGNRLLKYISINKILRLYSSSCGCKPEKIDKVLRKISNFRKGKMTSTSLEEISTVRVVILTLQSACRFITPDFSTDHFDYIFIDEAGSVNEPESYIPISAAGFSRNKEIFSQIVLAGDHKQIGPTIKNSFVAEMGLEISLMQRLMDTDRKYKLIYNEYDHNFVVQLRQNYRNHPAIIRFSNINFYNSKLIPMNVDDRKFGLKLKSIKLNPDFPIIFHSTESPSVKVGTSLENEEEVKILSYYLGLLLNNGIAVENDIGIISPYSAQRDQINKKIGKKYRQIEVGTVDAFQGREKKIIMVSCVRSGTDDVGFLRNEKRLNVALTRAKSLMIIIGNVETLQKSHIWNEFIKYCQYRNAIHKTRKIIHNNDTSVLSNTIDKFSFFKIQ